MAAADSSNRIIDAVFDRLARDENLRAPIRAEDEPRNDALAIIDLNDATFNTSLLEKVRHAPFVLVLGISAASVHPLWLALIRSTEYVLLDCPIGRSRDYALFMRAAAGAISEQ